MRTSFPTLFLILFDGCAIQSHVNELPNAQIFVERPENNGSINIVPCVVELDATQEITLSGGQTNSFSVRPGKYFPRAYSANPYEITSKSSGWKSNLIKITITDSQTGTIIIEPKSDGSTYIGGWTLAVR